MLIFLALLSVGIVGSALLGEAESEANDETGLKEDFEIPNDVKGPDYDATDETNNMFDDMEPLETILVNDLIFGKEYLENGNPIFGDIHDNTLDGSSGTLAGSQDHLFGGSGDDHLVGGQDDVLIGGAGSDTFEVAQQDEVHILDFEPDEVIILRYSGSIPVITGEANDDGTSILADGYAIAYLDGVFDFDFNNVVLSPER